MLESSRREFIRNCGIGVGLAMTSNLWLGVLFNSAKAQAGPERFGISVEDMKKLLEIALSKGGEFSELYFEYSVTNSVVMSEDIIKSSSESVQLGVGVRVLKGEQTGYGFTNDMTFESIKSAAITAAAIADGNAKAAVANLNISKPSIQIYDLKNPFFDKTLDVKIDLVKQAYNAAKNHDSKIVKISSSMAEDIQYVTIANSEGLLISDERPQVRLMVQATAFDNKNRTTAYANAGGRIGVDFYKQPKTTPAEIGKRAAEEAILLLSAIPAPPGEQTVVLGSHQSGVMIHEAVGHPLEADGVW
ncbi:MAG: TldD/PmbA family protein, partial [Bacteroidota bacterium]